jgi:hypothetical protein
VTLPLAIDAAIQPKEQTMDIANARGQRPANQADELTADDLEQVWGGKPSAAPQKQPEKYLEYRLDTVMISGYSL